MGRGLIIEVSKKLAELKCFSKINICNEQQIIMFGEFIRHLLYIYNGYVIISENIIICCSSYDKETVTHLSSYDMETVTHLKSYDREIFTHKSSYVRETVTNLPFYVSETLTHLSSYVIETVTHLSSYVRETDTNLSPMLGRQSPICLLY